MQRRPWYRRSRRRRRRQPGEKSDGAGPRRHCCRSLRFHPLYGLPAAPAALGRSGAASLQPAVGGRHPAAGVPVAPLREPPRRRWSVGCWRWHGHLANRGRGPRSYSSSRSFGNHSRRRSSSSGGGARGSGGHPTSSIGHGRRLRTRGGSRPRRRCCSAGQLMTPAMTVAAVAAVAAGRRADGAPRSVAKRRAQRRAGRRGTGMTR